MFNITRQSIHRQSRVWPYRKKHQEKVWTACATFTYLHSNAWTQYSMDYNPLEDICFGHAWGYMLGTIRRYIHVYIYLFTQRVYLDVLRQCSLFDIHTREAEAKILGFISSTLNFLWCPLAQHPLVPEFWNSTSFKHLSDFCGCIYL